MTNYKAVIIAGIFHYCVRLAIFIEALKPQCKDVVGGVPGILTLIGFCLFLADIEIFPEHYSYHQPTTFRVIEFVLSLLAIEFFMIMIWSRIEYGMVMLIKHILSRGDLYREMGGDNFLTLIIGGISVCFLLWFIVISNSIQKVPMIISEVRESIQTFYQKIKATRSSRHQPACVPPTSCIPATIHHCQPIVSSIPLQRNPNCPVHGDLEITGSMKKANSRAKKNK